MTEETTSETGTPAEGAITIVPVPEGQAQAVMEFVASLKTTDADVGGHMLNVGLAGAGHGAGLAATPTLTGCSYNTSGGSDMTCTDAG